MDIRQIERLMRSMEQHGVTRLEISEGEMTIALAREDRRGVVAAALPVETRATAVEASPAQAPEAAKTPEVDAQKIVSPMVGTFHPRAKDPVKAGTKLRKGDVVCVIEAMKLMNDVVMEEDGEVTFLALKDGDMVEFGQMIATYKKR